MPLGLQPAGKARRITLERSRQDVRAYTQWVSRFYSPRVAAKWRKLAGAKRPAPQDRQALLERALASVYGDALARKNSSTRLRFDSDF
jgi:hypothetical protein